LSLVAAVVELDSAGRSITVERMLEDGRQVVRSKLPAVVSVVKEINEPRYPSFMGIRKASRMEIPEWSAADVGLAEVPAAVLGWPEVFAPPKTETRCELIEGDSPGEIATKMVDRLVEEKVI
jgi:electron transfer flavoprotein beta subunit